MNEAQTFSDMNDLPGDQKQPRGQKHWHWVVWTLGLGFLSLGVQAAALWASPSSITELSFASSRGNADAIVSAWNLGYISKQGIASAVWIDFLLIFAYGIGLQQLCQWASNPNAERIVGPEIGWEWEGVKIRLERLWNLPARLHGLRIRVAPSNGRWSVTCEHHALPWCLTAISLAAIFDAMENGLTLAYLNNLHSPWHGHFSPWSLLFAVATAKTLLLGLVGWYIVRGFTQWKKWPPAREVIRYCGFSIFACIAAPGALFFGGQGAELFRILYARTGQHPIEIIAATLVAMLLFSLACWGSARVVLDNDTEYFTYSVDEDGKRKAMCWTVEWVPRFTGFVPLLFFLYLSQRGTGPFTTLTMGILGILILFGWYTIYRRSWKVFSSFSDDHWKRSDQRTCLVIWLIGSVVLVVFGILGPYRLARISIVGPIAAWLLGFALSVPFFSYLVFKGRQTKRPVLGVFLVYAFFINAMNLNDDHGVRYYKSTTKSASPAPTTINDGFTAWLAPRVSDWQKDPKHKNVPYPVLFVAAEGGGIRAAAQVTTTMARLHERPEDVRHLFAISGVSGGSLGAAVYCTLIREPANRDHPWPEKARQVFTTDLLSPTVASLAGPEAVQRFLPFAVPRIGGEPDYTNEWQLNRGRALDASLETAYANAVGQKVKNILLRKRLREYPTPGSKDAPPALFLNTTCVETGQAMVISTLVPDRKASLRPPFETLYDVGNDFDLELSVAACLSARFPLASPPGYLPQVRETDVKGAPPGTRVLTTVKYRYVDGGYCENTGLGTVSGLIDTLRHGDSLRKNLPWKPVVLAIRYDSKLAGDQADGKPCARDMTCDDPGQTANQARADHPRRTSGFDEILGPVLAFFHGWGGPPGSTRDSLQHRPGISYHYVVFGDRDPKHPLILGWFLSEESYDDMAKQLIDSRRLAPSIARLHQVLSGE